MLNQGRLVLFSTEKYCAALPPTVGSKRDYGQLVQVSSLSHLFKNLKGGIDSPNGFILVFLNRFRSFLKPKS